MSRVYGRRVGPKPASFETARGTTSFASGGVSFSLW